MRVEFGCGKDKRKGYIGVDIEPDSEADIFHDLEKAPYPFDDNEVDEVYSRHTIEHLSNPMTFFKEIWRICKPNAKVVLKFPHFTRVFDNFGHKSGTRTSIFFEGSQSEYFYDEMRFTPLGIRYTWRCYDGKNKFKTPIHFAYYLLNIGVNFLININWRLTEEMLCFWVGGIEDVCIEGSVIKNKQIENGK